MTSYNLKSNTIDRQTIEFCEAVLDEYRSGLPEILKKYQL